MERIGWETPVFLQTILNKNLNQRLYNCDLKKESSRMKASLIIEKWNLFGCLTASQEVSGRKTMMDIPTTKNLATQDFSTAALSPQSKR